jgi:hypothetical protein
LSERLCDVCVFCGEWSSARIITPEDLPLAEEEEEGLLPPALPEVPAYKK